MANVQIPQLGPALSLNGTEQIEIVQQGMSKRASLFQLAEINALSLINNITENASYFPLYSIVTNTTLSPNPVLYTSDTHYNYNPGEGRLTAQRAEASQGIFLNAVNLTQSYTIPTGDNAISMGPLNVTGVITVPAGSVWGVI